MAKIGILFIFILLLVVFAYPVRAQLSYSVNQYDYYSFTRNTFKPTISFYLKNKLNESLSITTYSLVNRIWGQGLLGLEYSPYKWIALEMQTGFETNIEAYGYKRNLIRFANMIALKSNHFVFTGRYSYGSTGILTLRAYYVLNRFGVGALYSTFYGYGPVVQYQIGESPFRVWTSAMYKTNTKEYGAMIGVNFSIKNFVRD